MLCSYLIGLLSIIGCSSSNVKRPDYYQQQLDKQMPGQEKEYIKKVTASTKWINDANARDIAERNSALQQAPNRSKAMAMEVDAMNETYKKRQEFSHQPKFKSMSVDQKIQGNKDIITKSEAAMREVRQSHYQIFFQPKW